MWKSKVTSTAGRLLYHLPSPTLAKTGALRTLGMKRVLRVKYAMGFANHYSGNQICQNVSNVTRWRGNY